MKLLVITISFVLITICTSGQTKGFDLLVNSPDYDSKSLKIIELEDEGYIISYTINEYNSDYRTLMLAKISYSGEILLQKEQASYEYYYYSSELLKIDEESFISLSYKKDESDNCFLWIVKYNTDVEVIWEKEHPIDYNFITFYESLIDNNGHIVATGFCEAEDVHHKHLCLAKFDNDGNLLNLKVFEDSNSAIGFGLLANKRDNGYRVYTKGYMEGVMIKTDADFNPVSFFDYPIDNYNNRAIVTAQWLTDSTYIVSTEKNYWHGSFDESQMGLMIYNTQDELLAEAEFGKLDTVEYPAYLNSISFIDADSIYNVGESGVSESFFSDGYSYIMINKVNKNLNQHWQKFYGGDAYYFVRTVLATQDGGCIVLADRDDQKTDDYRRDCYVLKINSDGEINTLIGKHKVQEATVSLFPNPADDFIQIHTIAPYNKISIYSLQGNLLISSFEPSNTIFAGDLAQGIYLYKISYQNQIIKTGKFIKR